MPAVLFLSLRLLEICHGANENKRIIVEERKMHYNSKNISKNSDNNENAQIKTGICNNNTTERVKEKN